MISQLKMGMLGLGLSAVLALAGCQSGGAASAAPSHEMAADAVHCDGCKTITVRTPVYNGKTMKTYRESERMQCPDCKDAIENFFSTGKLEHHCKACGGNMVACEGH